MLWNTKIISYKENSNINPQYPYSFSKYIGEETIKHWSKVYGIKYVYLDYLMFMELDLELMELMVQH